MSSLKVSLQWRGQSSHGGHQGLPIHHPWQGLEIKGPVGGSQAPNSERRNLQILWFLACLPSKFLFNGRFNHHTESTGAPHITSVVGSHMSRNERASSRASSRSSPPTRGAETSGYLPSWAILWCGSKSSCICLGASLQWIVFFLLEGYFGVVASHLVFF